MNKPPRSELTRLPLRWLAAIAGGCLLAGTAAAQDMAPIERPVLKVGDSWTYRTLDGWNNNEIRRTLYTLAALEGAQSITREKDLATEKESTITNNADLQPCRSMQNDTTVVCAGAYRFPFTAGYKHSYRKLPTSSGRSYFDADCEGKGMEKVKVPAGEFDAFRIDCKGRWTLVFGGNASGNFQQTLWYAPAVRNQVRSTFEDRLPNGSPNTKLITELVEHKPAP